MATPSALVASAACFECIPDEMRRAAELYLLALNAKGSMDPATIVKNSACFTCVPPEMRDAVRLYLLALAAGQSNPGAIVQAAACFTCIPPEMRDAVLLYLLANSSGPGCTYQNFDVGWTPATFDLGAALSLTTSLSFSNGDIKDVNGNVFTGTITFNQTALAKGMLLSNTTGVSAISFPNLVSVDPNDAWNANFLFNFNSVLTQFSAPLLTTVGSQMQVNSSPLLASISLASLTFVGGGLQLQANNTLASVSLPLLTTCNGQTSFLNDIALTSLSLPAAVTLKGLTCQGCTVLASFSAPNLFPTDGQSYTFLNCALVQSSVDAIIAACVANPAFGNTVGSHCTLNGGTNATPSSTGLANKAILNGRRAGICVTN